MFQTYGVVSGKGGGFMRGKRPRSECWGLRVENLSLKRGARSIMAFDERKRERLLTVMEVGQTVEQACAITGIGRATVTRWVAAGRRPDAPAEVREFSRRY